MITILMTEPGLTARTVMRPWNVFGDYEAISAETMKEAIASQTYVDIETGILNEEVS